MTSALTLTSLMAPNADPVFAAVARHLERSLGIQVSFLGGPWEDRHRALVRGHAHVAAVCGFVHAFDPALAGHLELVAAPVPSAARYGGRPVYFTDVVVPRASPVRAFADLRGRSWAYNEPQSHSGYRVTLWHLARLGERGGYFGRAVCAGGHQEAIDLVARGEVDAAGVDSYVLDRERALRPEQGARLRTVESLGPSPSPPLVASPELPGPLRRRLALAVTAMHRDPEGRRALDDGQLAGFRGVRDADYAPIRAMAAAGEGVSLVAGSTPAGR